MSNFSTPGDDVRLQVLWVSVQTSVCILTKTASWRLSKSIQEGPSLEFRGKHLMALKIMVISTASGQLDPRKALLALLQCPLAQARSNRCCCLVAQSCPILRDPMDGSLPGFTVHEIFQARVLEWGAIAFSWILLY